MRAQFATTVTRLLGENEKVVLLLGDIGVHAFRDAFKAFPDRVFNLGILEQSMVGVAAGWALAGYLPIVHTIAPFLVERAYEQLKVDFGYQNLRGVFVSVGGSYDYASLGCTHHCPADVSLIGNIPGFSIFVPGTPEEAAQALSLRPKGPTYIRLSEHSNRVTRPFGLSSVISHPFSAGPRPTILAVGPTLDLVLKATEGRLADIFYTSVISHHMVVSLVSEALQGQPIIVVENYYSSQIVETISRLYFPKRIAVTGFNVCREFVTSYGTKPEVDESIGFTVKNLQRLIDTIKL